MQLIHRNEINFREVLALGDMFEEYGGQRIASDVLKRGGGKDEFMRRISERARSKPLHHAADHLLGIDSEDRDVRGYSIARALRAAMERNWDGAGLERTVSNILTTKTESVPNGFFVPLGVLARDFSAGTASQAGNLIGAGIDGSRVADPLRNVGSLAALGATFLTGLKMTLNLPRFESASSASWGAETDAATALTETTVLATLAPKRIAVTLTMSRQALLQAEPALDVALSRHLVSAIMELVEDSAINGDGTSNAPTGLRSTTGIGEVVGGTNGSAIAWSHLVDLEKTPTLAGAAETQFSGYLVNGKTRAALRNTLRATGLPFIWEGGERPLLGHRAAVSELMPSDLDKGTSTGVCSTLAYSTDWRELVIGIYGGGVDLLLDRVTLADQGLVRIVASILVGVGVNLPAAFAKMDDALTA